MKFSEAMKIVEEGGMVRREQWQEHWVIRLGNSAPIFLMEHMELHLTRDVIYLDDASAKDWVEVKDYCTCAEPIKRWKESSGWYCTICYKTVKLVWENEKEIPDHEHTWKEVKHRGIEICSFCLETRDK